MLGTTNSSQLERCYHLVDGGLESWRNNQPQFISVTLHQVSRRAFASRPALLGRILPLRLIEIEI